MHSIINQNFDLIKFFLENNIKLNLQDWNITFKILENQNFIMVF